MYIPNKRERYGIKIYMLCESSTGYLSDFIVYTGADTIYPAPDVPLPKNFLEYTNPSKVVLSLMTGYYNKGYNLALDNLYTSPELLKALYKNGTDAYGNLRKNEGLPEDFWQWNPVKGVGEPAEVKYCDKTYMVMRWNDAYKTKKKKVVSMLSTKHTAQIQETEKLHHSTKQPIRKPDVIVEYNKTMGGIDNLSRVIVPYALARKGVKWYRKLAEVFMDFCIYNAYVIWKQLNESKKTHYDFREQLVNAIIMHHLHDEGPKGPGGYTPKVKQTTIDNPLRLKGKHFSEFIPIQPPDTKRKRKKCH
ncbi:piggyBac transposable element-derived protein 4-like [Clytia hemisphaerica]|uniref:piggyBac transposable element-derived protein 4-like n=1 Tax=Clytia hemisphaerica TaxID=252671 RepID=UPI0034D5C662